MSDIFKKFFEKLSCNHKWKLEKEMQGWLETKLKEAYQLGRKDGVNEAIKEIERELNCLGKLPPLNSSLFVRKNVYEELLSSLTKLITMDYPDICMHGLDRKDCRECS